MAKKAAEINPKSSLRLKELLATEEITAKKLAEKAGTTPNTISKIMRGKAPLSQTIAQGIAKAFPGTRAAYLMGLDDFKTETDETLYPIAEKLVSERIQKKAVDHLLGSLGFEIIPNEEAHPVFPEVGTFNMDNIGSEEFFELVDKLYSASNSPDAYIIKKGGKSTGYCNETERKALYDQIINFSEYMISRLCREEESQDGNSDQT